MKRKRWVFLRMYNKRFSLSAFRFSTSKAALKHFRKLSRKKPTTSGLERFLLGTGDRLDVNLLILGLAPTVFWARQYTELGLLKVNGQTVQDKEYRLKVGDQIEWNWAKIQRLRSNFCATLKKSKIKKTLPDISLRYPKNFEYHPSVRVARYLRLPKLGDLPENGRINIRLFNWFRLDSGLGKK